VSCPCWFRILFAGAIFSFTTAGHCRTVVRHPRGETRLRTLQLHATQIWLDGPITSRQQKQDRAYILHIRAIHTSHTQPEPAHPHGFCNSRVGPRLRLRTPSLPARGCHTGWPIPSWRRPPSQMRIRARTARLYPAIRTSASASQTRPVIMPAIGSQFVDQVSIVPHGEAHGGSSSSAPSRRQPVSGLLRAGVSIAV